MELHVVPALVCALIGLAEGACVPWLISLVPEPEPVEPEELGDEEPDEPKELYTEIAARSGLWWKAGLATAAANALVAGHLGWDWELLYLVPLAPVLVALSVIDWRTKLLPTRIVWPATIVMAALVVAVWLIGGGDPGATDDLVRAGSGFLISYGFLYLLWFVHSSGLGYGDVRLGGLLGIALGHLGWGELLVGLWSGFLLGGIGGGLLAALRIVDRTAFPFGPFLALGALVGVLVGDTAWSYLVTG